MFTPASMFPRSCMEMTDSLNSSSSSTDSPKIKWAKKPASSASAELGKQLRESCADRSGPISDSLAVVRALLATEGCDCNMPNRNGKTAIHFAAQLRSDTEVLALLVEAHADVNVATHRGHTPLIYAAGRCRPQTVEFLLDHGADAATWTVNGDCAVSMGRSKGLPAELLQRLIDNQKASANPREFKDNERAQRAQEEHRSSCAVCRRQFVALGAAPAVGEDAVELAAQLGAAAALGTTALSAALLKAASLDASALRRALEFSLSAGGRPAPGTAPDAAPGAVPVTAPGADAHTTSTSAWAHDRRGHVLTTTPATAPALDACTPILVPSATSDACTPILVPSATSGRSIALTALPRIGGRCHFDRHYTFRSLGSFGTMARMLYVMTSNEDRLTPAHVVMWTLEIITSSAPVIVYLNFRSERHLEMGAAAEWLSHAGWDRRADLTSSVTSGAPNGPYAGPVFSKVFEPCEVRSSRRSVQLMGSEYWEGTYLVFVQTLPPTDDEDDDEEDDDEEEDEEEEDEEKGATRKEANAEVVSDLATLAGGLAFNAAQAADDEGGEGGEGGEAGGEAEAGAEAEGGEQAGGEEEEEEEEEEEHDEGDEGGDEGGGEGGGMFVEEEALGTAPTCEQLLRAARDEALGRSLGKGARGRARRPVRMVAGALLSALQAPGVLDGLVRAGTQLGALVDAADAFIAAELVARWPPQLRATDACVRAWQRLVRVDEGWAAVGTNGAPKQRNGGAHIMAWKNALRWAANLAFDGWQVHAARLFEEAERAAVLQPLLTVSSPRDPPVRPPERFPERFPERPAGGVTRRRCCSPCPRCFGSWTEVPLGAPACNCSPRPPPPPPRRCFGSCMRVPHRSADAAALRSRCRPACSLSYSSGTATALG